MLAVLRRSSRLPISPFARCISHAAATEKEVENSALGLIDILAQAPSNAAIIPASGKNRAAPRSVWKQFQTGNVVKPFDLSFQGRSQPGKARRSKTVVAPPSTVCRHRDVFHQLNIDPRTCTTNSTLLLEYVSEMGKIYGRPITGLTSKNQRLLGKTIRRAKQMGLIPILHRGPGHR